MSMNKSKIVIALFSILFLFFCVKLFSNAGNVLWWEKAISLETPQGFWSLQRIEQIRQAEQLQDIPVTFAAWGQQEDVSVRASQLERTIEVPVLWTDGPAALICQEGNQLDADDTEGCLIGEEIAVKLFGSSQVIGEQLTVDKRELIIRGTLRTIPKAIISSCPQEKTDVLNRMNLRRPADADSNWSPDNFLLRTGINACRLDITLAVDAQRLLTGIIPLLLLIHALIFFHRRFKASRGKPLDQLLLFLLAAAALGIYLRFFYFLPDTLKTYAPGQWSDLEYLSAFIKSKNEAVTVLTTLPKTQADLPLFTTLRSAFFYTLCALIAYFIGPYKLYSKQFEDSL